MNFLPRFLQVKKRCIFYITPLISITALAQVNWHRATIFCQQFYMKLLTIESAEDQEDLRIALTTNGMALQMGYHFWTSGTDLHNEGEWRWMTNSKPMAPYSNGPIGQPDNAGKNEHCAQM